MENIEKGTVRNLVATFLDKEHTGKSAGFKEKDKKLRTSKSCECLSERAQRSTELPLKGKRSEIPDFDNETQSHWSKHIPFPNKISGRPGLVYSLDETQSDCSKDIPVNFSSKKSGKPDLDYSLDETQSDCSKDIPVNFSNKKDYRQKKLVSEAIGSLTAKYELSKKHPTAFKRGRSGGPGLVYSLDETQSDCSKDIPVNFSNKKDFGQKELVSEAIGSLRAKYEHSNEHHVTFKEARSGRPGLVYSLDETQSDCSKDIPVNFSNKKDFGQKELVSEAIGSLRAKYEHSNEHHVTFKEARPVKPDVDYSQYETESELSRENPHFSNKIEISRGIPKHWGKSGIVSQNTDPSRFQVPNLPSAVYHQKTANIAHHDTTFQSPKLDYPEIVESISSSETSEYSSLIYTDSHDGKDEVICDLCQENAAVRICQTCNNLFCEPDALQHSKDMQKHILKDIGNEAHGRCCQHQKSKDFYCRTDQMHICSSCVEGYHKKHDILSPRTMRQVDVGEDFGQHDSALPPPGKIKFLKVGTNSVVLTWGFPKELKGTEKFRVKWSSLTEAVGSLIIKDLNTVEINDLQLGERYFFSVATEDEDGNLSRWVKESVLTAVPPPRHLFKDHSESTTLSLTWTKGENMEGIPHQFLITVTSPAKKPFVICTKSCQKTLSDLEPDTEYSISVCTLLNDKTSDPVSITVHTELCLREVLSIMGLEEHYDIKLKIYNILKITRSDTEMTTAESLHEAFLKRLFMGNTNARSVNHMSSDLDVDKKNVINPLDLITALFLCSDKFLQQKIIEKMVLCQFAVPLLLPDSETRELTMMLWSMREVVRTFKPLMQAFRGSSTEERLVQSEIALISFVRLGKHFLSKSQMLNQVLSNTEQYHDIFYHSGLECGDVPRRISEGLVDFSWYLPCGIRSVDKFNEPMAVANLRGDIRTFVKQFTFLCQSSAVVYIFCDEAEVEYLKTVQVKDVTGKIILISSKKGKSYRLKYMTIKPSIKTKNISETKRTEKELARALQESVSRILENKTKKVSLENLAERARSCEILVDEDTDECKTGLRNSRLITSCIDKISEFKEQELPCQGNIWKAISGVQMEHCRLRKVGKLKTEDYRKSLEAKEKEFKKKQHRFEMTPMISNFVKGISASEAHCSFFLKWMEMTLEDFSRQQLSALLDQYKRLKHESPKETDIIADVDQQISISSLGMQHFFRECGQRYTCANGVPEFSNLRKRLEQLPYYFAQLILDSFPFELVDGDAGNIPMKWMRAVLAELHHLIQSNSRVKVISVIGEENSGKSTLLNAMFGTRFSINRGMCTRGAFMQLITVSKRVKREIGCDCIMIIDTEGLKAHQMIQDDHSHERDKEVASLAVALSDITVVTFSKESSTDKDFLRMVVNVLARVKVADKKTLCHFVQVDINEVSVSEGKKRDKELLDRLNVLIQRDAEINARKLADLVEFDPYTWSWYLPSAWKGTPPMAAYSTDYSETAQALKSRLLEDLKKCPERDDLMDFAKRIEHIWKSL